MTVPTYRGFEAMPPKKPRGGLWWKIMLLILGVPAVVFVGLVVILAALAGNVTDQSKTAAENQASQAAQANERARTKASDRAAMEARRSAEAIANIEYVDASDKTRLEADGWTYYAPRLYHTKPPASKISCGSIPCATFSVLSTDANGCPGGIYIQVSFLDSGNGSVGRGSYMTAALAANQEATFKILDTSGSATSVDITSMRCL